ncbi:MAG: hypothetical protein NZ529_10250 [Cytophagaceae bacterium]|nr:hypothetical protein [Cytophagaceae bacterium]MDW8457166.1 hypothetical protein [Cytophagaceae bacterium]
MVKKSLFILAVLSLLISANVSYKKTKIAKGITVSLPSGFVPMSDADIAARYPSTKKPLAMFTSSKKDADFGVNVSKTKVPGADVPFLHKTFKATILESFDEVNFIQEGVKEVNGRLFSVFEYTSEADGIEKYIHVMYTLHKSKVLVFNFSCDKSLLNEWKPISEYIMASVKINDAKLKLPEDPSQKHVPPPQTPLQILEMQKKTSKKSGK